MSRISRILSEPKKYLSINYILNNVIGGRLFKYWRKLSPFIKSDRLFLKVYYRLAMGESLDLENPKSFTQKLQWLKLHNTNPLYSKMVDKYQVREIIKKKIGKKYLIPLLGVWDRIEDIDFKCLPDQFVLKTTHDSGNIIVCKDKSTFDKQKAALQLSKALKYNYFYKSREFPYKNAIPRIIAEKYMFDESQAELIDYKFFCFHGQPKILLVVTNRGDNKRFSFFDMNFSPLPIETGVESAEIEINRPDNFNKMVEIAKQLSKDIIHVRIDLYNIEGKILFGEYTFHHGGGVDRFSSDKWNIKVGEMIYLPDNNINSFKEYK